MATYYILHTTVYIIVVTNYIYCSGQNASDHGETRLLCYSTAEGSIVRSFRGEVR